MTTVTRQRNGRFRAAPARGAEVRRRASVAILLVGSVALLGLIMAGESARAEDPVVLSIILKDYKFEPAELHAPAGKPISIRVKNLNPIPSEFESSDLHFEKIVPAGSEGTVHVRPLQPGRYNFFDDFHRDTQGYLVVP